MSDSVGEGCAHRSRDRRTGVTGIAVAMMATCLAMFGFFDDEGGGRSAAAVALVEWISAEDSAAGRDDSEVGSRVEKLPESEGISDCNENGIDDLTDIISGRSADCNRNHVPDECDIADGILGSDDCRACLTNADCDDGNACTFDLCKGECAWIPTVYGDVTGARRACVPDGAISVHDIRMVLDGFTGEFAGGCEAQNLDISSREDPCLPDGIIDLYDIFGILDAFFADGGCCVDPP